MVRLVEHAETGPAVTAKDSIVGANVHLCRCGLSRTPPFCDGSHRVTRDEPAGTLWRYSRTAAGLVREPVEPRGSAAAPKPPGFGAPPRQV